MEQREKLIELITAADDEYVYSDDDKDGTGEIAYIADHLFANGVVVLPCKVGDTVYRIPRSAIRKYTVVYIGISADPFASYMNIAWYRDEYNFENRSVNFAEIGKTVFLTREEAERALAKRKGGDE